MIDNNEAYDGPSVFTQFIFTMYMVYNVYQ